MTKTSGWPGSEQVGLDAHPSGAVQRRPGRLGQRPRPAASLHAGRPQHRARGDASPRSAVAQPSRVRLGCRSPTRARRARSRRAARAPARALADSSAGRRAARGRPPPRSRIRASAGSMRAEVAAQRVRGRSRPACPPARRRSGPPPTTTKVSRPRGRAGSSRARPARRRAACGAGSRWRPRSSSGPGAAAPSRRGRSSGAARPWPRRACRRPHGRAVARSRRTRRPRGRSRSPRPAAPRRLLPLQDAPAAARRCWPATAPPVATW